MRTLPAFLAVTAFFFATGAPVRATSEPMDLQIGTIELKAKRPVLVQSEGPGYTTRIPLVSGVLEGPLKALAGTGIAVRIRGVIEQTAEPAPGPGGGDLIPDIDPGQFVQVVVHAFTAFAPQGPAAAPEERVRSLALEFIRTQPHSRSDGQPVLKIASLRGKVAIVKVTIPHYMQPGRVMSSYTLAVNLESGTVERR